MERDQIRKAIATDLRGTPSRNPDSLMSTLPKALNVAPEEISKQIAQMSDLKHIVPIGQASIRLSEEGERFYFSTDKEKTIGFLKTNWPHLTSNVLALFALVVSIIALIY